MLISAQSDQRSTTPQQLAEQYKVAVNAIRRDGHFGEQLDARLGVGSGARISSRHGSTSSFAGALTPPVKVHLPTRHRRVRHPHGATVVLDSTA